MDREINQGLPRLRLSGGRKTPEPQGMMANMNKAYARLTSLILGIIVLVLIRGPGAGG
jgi:hypothetical protein